MIRQTRAAIAIGTLAIAGCGGAAREAAPSSPPTGGAAAPTSEADKREEPRVSRPADAVPASAPEAHPTVRTTGAKADGGHVDPMVEFSNASATFLAAGDCASMCRALASMQRATEHLCALGDGGDGDKKRCSDAKAKLASATAKVQATCGGCG